MKTNKVKGFTLVELIVVIAIIGVLAAILVPSMLGYVKKANQSAVNSNAKTIYNAAATAVTDCDTKGSDPCSGGTTGTIDLVGATPGSSSKTSGAYSGATKDFSDFFDNAAGTNILTGLKTVKIGIVSGAVTGTYVEKASYKGSYPTAIVNSSTGSCTITSGVYSCTPGT